MSLQSYRTLVAIAEVESFSEAAKRLNMTLSAVSMQMKSLEQMLGAAIFDRSVRPPRLTPLGRAIVTKAQEVVTAEEALTLLARGEDELRGTYRIGFIATASVRLLPGFLNAARRDAREARFLIETGLSETLRERVAKGQLDAAVITAGTSERLPLETIILRREELVYAIPKGFAETPKAARFAALPFMLFMPHSGIGRLVAAHLDTLGQRGAPSMIFDSVEAIMECVNAGIGFTILPRPDVDRYACEGVQIEMVTPQGLSREIVLVAASGSFHARALGNLAALITGTETEGAK